MKINHRLFIGLFVAFLIVIIFSLNIGRSLAMKSLEKEQQSLIKPVDLFKEKQVIDFLRSFYTFEQVGDNYGNYKDLLSKELQMKEAERNQLQTNPQFFGHGEYVKSEIYLKKDGRDEVEVICIVYFKTSLMNDEGTVITKGINNQAMLKLFYVYDSKKNLFLVTDYENLESFDG